jgi:CheY-like chemotaxis protein
MGTTMATILVIDDETGMRKIMERTLRSAGHTVLQAKDGRDGLALLAGASPDLVITDILMPEMEGLETVQQIRKTRPDIKILAISGDFGPGAVDYLGYAQAFGAAAILHKPFRLAELLEVVDQLLSRPERA